MSLQGTIRLSGISAQLQGGTIAVTSAMAWYWVWAQSSVERFQEARAARVRLEQATEGQGHIPMMEEFYASLLTITGCAYSLEALDHDLLRDSSIAVVKPVLPKKIDGKKTRRDQHITALLTKVCRLSVPPKAIEDLFARRNDAVHPQHIATPTLFHPPIRSNVTAPIVNYSTETAAHFLEVVRDVFSDLINNTEPAAEGWVQTRRAHLVQITDRISAIIAA